MSIAGGMPFLRVEGSHRECGRQVGEAVPDVLRRAVEFDADLPAGRSRSDQLALAARYPTQEANMRSEDWIEGPKAFAEKRKPNWKGR